MLKRKQTKNKDEEGLQVTHGKRVEQKWPTHNYGKEPCKLLAFTSTEPLKLLNEHNLYSNEGSGGMWQKLRNKNNDYKVKPAPPQCTRTMAVPAAPRSPRRLQNQETFQFTVNKTKQTLGTKSLHKASTASREKRGRCQILLTCFP